MVQLVSFMVLFTDSGSLSAFLNEVFYGTRTVFDKCIRIPPMCQQTVGSRESVLFICSALNFRWFPVISPGGVTVFHQRAWLQDKNKKMLLLDEDIVRKHLRHLHLEEERLAYV